MLQKNEILNVLTRLENYFQLIHNEKDTTCSIEFLAKELEVPIEVVRQDIIILSSDKCHNSVTCFEDDEEITLSSQTEEIMNGVFDQLMLEDFYEIYEKNKDVKKTSFNLSINETLALHQLMNSYGYQLDDTPDDERMDILDANTPFRLKRSPKFRVGNAAEFKLIRPIAYAIQEKVQIKFYFQKPSRNHSELYTVFPLKIIYNHEDNSLRLLCLKNNKVENYPFENIHDATFDKIQSFEKLLDPSAPLSDFIFVLKKKSSLRISDEKLNSLLEDIKNKAPHVWGYQFSQTDSVHVKVRFNENVRPVVERDLYRREKEKVLSPSQNGFFFFEDDIFGIDSFREWTRKFGPDAIFFEPEEIRNDILENLNQTIAYYE